MSHTRHKGKTLEQLTSDLKWFSVGRNTHPSCSRAGGRCQHGHGRSRTSQHHLGARWAPSTRPALGQLEPTHSAEHH